MVSKQKVAKTKWS